MRRFLLGTRCAKMTLSAQHALQSSAFDSATRAHVRDLVMSIDSKSTFSLERLQERAFGGEDVATRPGQEDDACWPNGPLLPGVTELLDDFATHLQGRASLRLTFLLGGAGNGKSFAARALGERLRFSRQSDDKLAQRIYSQDIGSTRVYLLNDATIAREGDYGREQPVALAKDIDRWWQEASARSVAGFCCVNRGIVVDEIRALCEHPEIGKLARSVLHWLASPSTSLHGEVGSVNSDAPRLLLGDHFYEEWFELDGRLVHVAALAVDACSLLDVDDETRESRAAGLFKSVLSLCRDEALARPSACPIRANVLQWSSPGGVSAWEAILTHAETASGRFLSYRDIWGLIALSILGPRLPSTSEGQSTLTHVDQLLSLSSPDQPLNERLAALTELSRFRAHNALFRSPVPRGQDAEPAYSAATPAHGGLSLVDPSVWGCEDSRKVEVAMQGIALGSNPSNELAAEGLLGEGEWAEFDAQVEEALIASVIDEACSDNVRRRLISWLSGYTTRLVGICRRHLGNAGIVKEWRDCYSQTAHGPTSLPLALDEALRAMLFPGHSDAPAHTVIVPLLAARVEPIRPNREGQDPVLAEAINHSSIGLTVRRLGGRLLVECTLTGVSRAVGQLLLDFHVLREALTFKGGASGQTESTSYLEPRIERCRAAALERLPETARRLVVLAGQAPVEISA